MTPLGQYSKIIFTTVLSLFINIHIILLFVIWHDRRMFSIYIKIIQGVLLMQHNIWKNDYFLQYLAWNMIYNEGIKLHFKYKF